MDKQLSDEQLARARQALLGERSSELIDLLLRLGLRESANDADPAISAIAIDLRWLNSDGRTLTPVGWLVADTVREYRFWLGRERRLHLELDYDVFGPQRCANKSVLEIGSGFGCNLLSLMRRTPGHFVGVEPVTVYRQLSAVFAEREGMDAPLVVDGRGEALPFADEQFDIALCYSAHQYMDVRLALREMARVLRPGGELQLTGGTLQSFSRGYARHVLQKRTLGSLKHYILTLTNTLSYQFAGRRVFVPKSAGATSAPVYPSYKRMRQWMAEAGLQLREDLVRTIAGETCFVAVKVM